MFDMSSSLNRRVFLRTTSGTVVFLSLGAPSLFAAQAAEGPNLVSVGYWAGAPRGARRTSSRSSSVLTSSSDLTSGDPRFLRDGVRIGVRSFYRAPQYRGRAGSFALDILYGTDSGSVPFQAWTFEQHGAMPAKKSQRSSFRSPVDALTTLDFVVRRGEEEQRISFSSNTSEGIPLRPGVYVIAFREADQTDAIDWSRIVVREGLTPGEENADGVLAMTSFGEEHPLPFNYLVIAVESA
jgi:hypothetical protein